MDRVEFLLRLSERVRFGRSTGVDMVGIGSVLSSSRNSSTFGCVSSMLMIEMKLVLSFVINFGMLSSAGSMKASHLDWRMARSASVKCLRLTVSGRFYTC